MKLTIEVQFKDDNLRDTFLDYVSDDGTAVELAGKIEELIRCYADPGEDFPDAPSDAIEVQQIIAPFRQLFAN